MFLRLNPAVHRRCDWLMVRTLKRRHPRLAHQLLGYYHRRSGAWVVCRWVSRSARLVTELFAAEAPSAFTSTDLAEVSDSLNYRYAADFRKWASDLRLDRHRELHRLDDQSREEASLREYLQRRLPGVQRDNPNALLGLELCP